MGAGSLVAAPWAPSRDAILETWLRAHAAWWERLDVFARPNLQRADIVAARHAVGLACAAEEAAALVAALRVYGAALGAPLAAETVRAGVDGGA